MEVYNNYFRGIYKVAIAIFGTGILIVFCLITKQVHAAPCPANPTQNDVGCTYGGSENLLGYEGACVDGQQTIATNSVSWSCTCSGINYFGDCQGNCNYSGCGSGGCSTQYTTQSCGNNAPTDDGSSYTDPGVDECQTAADCGASTNSCTTASCTFDASANGKRCVYNPIAGTHGECNASTHACEQKANTAAMCTNNCSSNADCATEPPFVNIDGPSNNSTVSGTVNINGWAIDNKDAAETLISSMKLYVNNTYVGDITPRTIRRIASPPGADVCQIWSTTPDCTWVNPATGTSGWAGWSYNWDTTKWLNGTYTITIVATDSDTVPHQFSVSQTVTLNNPPPTCTGIGAINPNTGAEIPINGSPAFATYFDINSHLLTFYAYGVRNATSVVFPTWSQVNGRDDLEWVPGTLVSTDGTGAQTWKAVINLGNHRVTGIDYGSYEMDVWMTGNQGTTGCAGTTFIVSQSPYGFNDGANCNIIAGWAQDPDTTNPITVALYDGNTKILGGIPANGPRTDSKTGFGFSFATPNSLKDGTVHSLWMYAEDNYGAKDFPLQANPKSIQCNISPRVYLDGPTGGTVSGNTAVNGWAVDNPVSAETLMQSLKFYVDGAYAADVPLRSVNRATPGDVCSDAFYWDRPDCTDTTAHGSGGWAGWSYTWDTTYVSNGNHTIRVDGVDSDSPTPHSASTTTYTVTVSNPVACNVGGASAASLPAGNTTYATSGNYPVRVDHVDPGATQVQFPTWSEVNGQNDLVWYNGTNLGGGVWEANVNLANHLAGSPEYGTFDTHIYVTKGSNMQYCTGVTFSRLSRPAISLAPTSMTFTGVQNQSPPAAQTFTVTNSGGSTLNWSASTNQSWCHVGTSSGTLAASATSAAINVTVDTMANGGVNNCTVSVSDSNASNSPQPLAVTYNVQYACQGPSNLTPTGNITANSSNLTWTASPGATSYNIRIDDGVNSPVYDDPRFAGRCGPHYYCENGIDAATYCSGSSCSVSNIPLTYGRSYTYWIDPSYPAPGASSYCNGATSFTDVPPPAISLNPTSFSFSRTQGLGTPPSQNMAVTNSGGGTLNWNATISNNTAGCSLSKTSGSLSANASDNVLIFVADPNAVSVGTLGCTITITGNASNSPQTAQVTYTVSPEPPLYNYIDGPCGSYNASSCPMQVWGTVNIAGWGADNTTFADHTTSATVYVDNVLLGTANRHQRNDLCIPTNPAWPDCPNLGYNINWDTSSVGENTTHTIKTVVTDTDVPTPQTQPATITLLVKTPSFTANNTGVCEAANLSWSNFSGMSSYRIFRNTTGVYPNPWDTSAGNGYLTTVNAPATSYTDTNVPVPGSSASYYYYIAGVNSAGWVTQALAANNNLAVGVVACTSNLHTSDKDVSSIVSASTGIVSPIPNVSDCDGYDTVPANQIIKSGDTVTFTINMCNSTTFNDATSLSIVDWLTNVQKPSGGWQMQYQDTNNVWQSITPSEDLSDPNNPVLTITFPAGFKVPKKSGPIATIRKLTFKGTVAPIVSGSTSDFLRNRSTISYKLRPTDPSQNDSVDANTGRILYYNSKANVPTRGEQAPQ